MEIPEVRRRLQRALLDGSRLRAYIVATCCVAVATLVRAWLLPGGEDVSPFQTFDLAVLVAGVVGGLGPGLWAVLLGGIIGTWLWLPPLGSLAVPEAGNEARLLLFVATGVLISGAAAMLRAAVRSQERLTRGSARIASLMGRAGRERDADRDLPGPVEPLTQRELEVLRLVALGLRNGEIARTLVVSENTVKTHLAHAFGKLGVRSRTEAVGMASALELLAEPAEPGARAGSGAAHEPAVGAGLGTRRRGR